MTPKISNTLSSFLEQGMIMEKNSLEVLSKIDNAMNSKTDSILVTVTDMSDENKTKTYRIPSFGFLKRNIERLDKTLQGIMSVDENTDSTIRLSDGSYRKLITTKLPCEAPDITEVDNISKFNVKSNWFFEDLMNPIVYVTLDLTGKVSDKTEKILVRRYILNCDTQEKRNKFDDLCSRSGNIPFEGEFDNNDFVGFILGGAVTYSLDEEIKELPPRNKKYSGTFLITDTSLPTSDYNGKIIKIYTLNKTTYYENETGTELELSVGDYLEKNTTTLYSRYKILSINGNKVTLELVEGVAGLDRGDEFRISVAQNSEIKVDIPVGLHEREVIFIKPIDPFSNIPADNWSPGIAFFTDKLVFEHDVKQTLSEYYRDNVVDYGQVMLSYARDYFPTIREAIKPNAPVLEKSDFLITQINGHLTENINVNNLIELISEKTTVGSEIENLSRQISDLVNYITVTDFQTDEEKQTQVTKLQELKDKQNLLKIQFDSIVNEIGVLTSNMDDLKPKYRVRGFWDMPAPKNSQDTGEQQIIRFRIRYKYLSADGQENPVTEIVTKSGKLGKFSNWTEVMSKVRERICINGEWVWKDIDISDKDDVKINQCDIPICAGEQVVIQVKSISEAGWPSNPIESDWSNALTIRFDDFPELKTENIRSLIEQNRIDTAVIKHIINE